MRDILTTSKRNNANLIGELKMNAFKATVTAYSNDKDVITTGLTLEEAVAKVVRNIYGYDQDEKYIIDSINEFASGERGKTFFCANDAAQVNIKQECK